MIKELNEKLDALERKIEAGNIIKEERSVKEWGGADVIICRQLENSIKEWLGDQSMVFALQETEPKRRAIITEYSKELSWLFYQLRDILSAKIDYISKHDFYGVLAQTAIDYIEKNKEKLKCDQLMYSVLDKARSFLNQ